METVPIEFRTNVDRILNRVRLLTVLIWEERASLKLIARDYENTDSDT
jgi:hypothetical protein